MKIHCIGNSHVNTFSNDNKVNFNISLDNNFILYWLGPIIAYNFYEHHLNKVIDIISSIDKSDYISLIVGEVDCRLHIPKQADEQNRSDYDITNECVTRLFRCYDYLIEQKYNLIVFSTHPTTNEGHDMSKSDRPIYGTSERRNNICKMWNEITEFNCVTRNIKYISFYDYLVNQKNITEMKYFLDYCHLNSSIVLPFIKKELLKNEINIA